MPRRCRPSATSNRHTQGLKLWQAGGNTPACFHFGHGNPKPAPDVYLKAVADRGVAPGDCVIVEDSMIGAPAARVAGMRCLGYAGAGNACALAPLVEQTFERMDQLPELLGV